MVLTRPTTAHNGKTQLGAYKGLDLAKACADAHPGYSVYDWEYKKAYNGDGE